MSTFRQGHIRAGENISSIGVTRSKIRGIRITSNQMTRGGGREDSAKTSLPREIFFGYITTTRGPYKYTRESSPIAIYDGRTICCRHVLPTGGKASIVLYGGLAEGITCAIILRQPRLVYRNRDMDAAKECRE